MTAPNHGDPLKADRARALALVRESQHACAEHGFAAGLAPAEEALLLASRCGDLPTWLEANRQAASVRGMLGDKTVAMERCAQVLKLLDDPSQRSTLSHPDLAGHVVQACVTWASAARYAPEVGAEEVLRRIEAVEEWLTGIDRPGWRAGLLSMRAGVLMELGRGDEAVGPAREAVVVRKYAPDGPGTTLGGLIWSLGNLLYDLGRRAEAEATYREALALPDLHRQDRSVSLKGLARCASARGDHATARALAEDAVQTVEPEGDDCLCPALWTLVEVLRNAGDVAGARAAAERHLGCARRVGGPHRLYYALRDVCDAALDAGDTEAARAVLDEMMAHAAAIDSRAPRGKAVPEGERRRERLAAAAPLPQA